MAIAGQAPDQSGVRAPFEPSTQRASERFDLRYYPRTVINEWRSRCLELGYRHGEGLGCVTWRNIHFLWDCSESYRNCIFSLVVALFHRHNEGRCSSTVTGVAHCLEAWRKSGSRYISRVATAVLEWQPVDELETRRFW